MTNEIASYITDVGRRARAASRIIGSASTATKSDALKQIAAAVDSARVPIRNENAKDMAAAEQNGIDQPLIDRLLLNDKGIDQMIEGISDERPVHHRHQWLRQVLCQRAQTGSQSGAENKCFHRVSHSAAKVPAFHDDSTLLSPLPDPARSALR